MGGLVKVGYVRKAGVGACGVLSLKTVLRVEVGRSAFCSAEGGQSMKMMVGRGGATRGKARMHPTNKMPRVGAFGLGRKVSKTVLKLS